jgi:peptide deformylase
MAILDILVYPDPRLTQISSPVEKFDDELLSFIFDLEETMRAGPPSAGIAAPQVGHFERIIIVDVSSKPKISNHGRLTLINPNILYKQGSMIGREGCLSVPEYTGNVSRAEKITLQAYNKEGKSLNYNMEGFEARAVQHEIDHLDGLLFLDRLVSRRSSLFIRKVYK